MEKPYISVKKAIDSVLKRDDDDATIIFPYPIKYINNKGKTKTTKKIPLKFLINAIRLINLEPVLVNNILSCYIFGSAVKPEYRKITKKYLFGLYVQEKETRVIANDIDIMCFVNNHYNEEHIKSMSTWERTISSTYGSYSETEYANFDISFIPAYAINNYKENYDFINHIRNYGVCLISENIINAKKYAIWEHNTVKNNITCLIPRDPNFLPSKNINQEFKQERFETYEKRM